jgi:hypothetical protein
MDTTEAKEGTAMNTTTIPNDYLDGLARESFVSALCRLAAEMPYCSDEQADREYRAVCRYRGYDRIARLFGVESGRDMMDAAIRVRAAAEQVTA